MKSRANIKSHPIHPMLIAFPVAFFIGTFISDAIGFFYSNPTLHIVASYLNIAGVITALLAAIPGLIDYLYTVPPNSSAKKRATKHALINVTNVVLFAGIWFYRKNIDASLIVIIPLELVGCVLLAIAGWMGGTLVYRNQIGIDSRYAYAGKWKEEMVDSSDKIYVADLGELQVNQMKLIHVGNNRIVLARSEKGYVAFEDRCTHKGGSLAGGAMICGTVQCPWHGSQFDTQTGEVKAGPASKNIKTFTVNEINGKVFLIL